MKDTFTEVTRKDFYLWQGAIKNYVPELKELHTKKGVKLTTVGDANKGRLEKYNSDENNRTLLSNNYFHSVGSIILSNGLEGNDHAQLFLFDIEDSPLMKSKVLGINKNTSVNNTYGFSLGNSQEEDLALFEAVQKLEQDGKAKTVYQADINGFNNNWYHNPELRQIIYLGLNGGDEIFHNEFVEHVEGVTGKKFADNENGVMGTYLSKFFKGWRPVTLCSVGLDARVGSLNYFRNKYGRLLAGSVGDVIDSSAEGATAREKIVSPTIIKPTFEQTLAVINNPDLNREGMIDAMSTLYKQ